MIAHLCNKRTKIQKTFSFFTKKISPSKKMLGDTPIRCLDDYFFLV